MQPIAKEEKRQQHEDYLSELGIKPTMLRQGDTPQHRGAADLEWDHNYSHDEKQTLLGEQRGRGRELGGEEGSCLGGCVGRDPAG